MTDEMDYQAEERQEDEGSADVYAPEIKDEQDSAWNFSNNWIWGLILVIGGAVLLAQNMLDIDLINLSNWWAVFILVPGLTMLAQGWSSYQRTGTLPTNRLFWGSFWVLMAVAFFTNLSFGLVWPFFLILAGLGLLARTFR